VFSWSKVPLLRLTLALIGGVILANHIIIAKKIILISLIGSLLTYTILFVYTRKGTFHKFSCHLGLLSLFCMMCIGYMQCYVHSPYYIHNHIYNYPHQIEAYMAIAMDDFHEKIAGKNVLIRIDLIKTNGKWQLAKGKVILQFKTPPIKKILYGDVLLIKGQPQAISKPKNPHEIDYSKILAIDQIYNRHSILPNQVEVILNEPPNFVKSITFRMLRYSKSMLCKYIHNKDVLGVVSALVLGDRDNLDYSLTNAYSASGTIHVLAVSGLHVGVLYILLQFLFDLLKIKRRSIWLRESISVAILLLYAFITGLSPSVLRATLMFACISVARIIGREGEGKVYNSLAISAFFLVLINPSIVFSVAFQLSYMAVLGICILSKNLHNLLSFKNSFLNKIWELATLSISAQIATTPLIIYYFHQFPTYFLFTNLLIVPIASVILYLGLTIITLGFCWTICTPIAWLLEQIVLGTNWIVLNVQKLPFNVIDNVYLDKFSVVMWYAVLIAFIIFLAKRKFRNYALVCILLLCLLVYDFAKFNKTISQNGIVFYSIKGIDTIDFINGNRSNLLSTLPLNENNKDYLRHISPNHLALGIDTVSFKDLDKLSNYSSITSAVWNDIKIIIAHGKTFFILDKCITSCFKNKTKVNILIIQDGFKGSLKSLSDMFDADLIILGSSVKRYLSEQLKAEAHCLNIKLYSLLEQGAFEMDL